MATTYGVYIHIPFCKSKCDYCDFYSLAGREEEMDHYQKALIAQLRSFAPRLKGRVADTIYFGGGTPSYYGEKRLRELLVLIQRVFTVSRQAEITVECNPDSVDWRSIARLRRAGVNRISLGAQTADPQQLRCLHRIHSTRQVVQAVADIRRAKITNLSLDLIYGLPDQDMASWLDTLNKAIALAPEHLSCYGLKVEEGTPLARQAELGLELPDGDDQADFYLAAVDRLRQAGYHQYEISNFSKPGKESRHNLKYWRMEEYAGFGPGAHSDFGGVRYGYVRDIDSYIAGRLVLSESETDSTLARDYEYVMLSLRTAAGIDRQTFEKRYRQRFQPMEVLFEQYEKAGLASRTEGGWRLTPKGFLVSNSIIAALQEALAQQRAARQAAMAEGNFRIV